MLVRLSIAALLLGLCPKLFADVHPTTVIPRPGNDELQIQITLGKSLISKAAREDMGKTLATLDSLHIGLIPQSFFKPIDTDIKSHIKNSTKHLSRHMPAPERTIIYLLELQIKMLDNLLALQHPDKLQLLLEERKQIRLLTKEQRVFGDARDKFVANVFRLLRRINKLQIALGVEQIVNATFPIGIKSQEKIEQHIVNNVLEILQASKSLPKQQAMGAS